MRFKPDKVKSTEREKKQKKLLAMKFSDTEEDYNTNCSILAKYLENFESELMH